MNTARVALRLFGRSASLLSIWMLAWSTTAGGVPMTEQYTNSEDRRFQILRNGREIGTHVFSFHNDAGKLIVEADLNIRVRFFFVTLYTYRQTSREVWSDGRLVRFTVRTMEDGRTSTIRGRATPSGFSVIGDEGSHAVPVDIMPATYWHPNTAKQTRLLDPTTGEVYAVAFSDQGVEKIETAAGIVSLHKYTMTAGDDITLWYDSQQRLTRARHRAPEDGSLIEFRLTADQTPERNTAAN